MKANLGSTDKLIRLLLAIVLIVLYYKEIIVDTMGIVALIVALMLTLTSLISFCPLYTLFGASTCKREKK